MLSRQPALHSTKAATKAKSERRMTNLPGRGPKPVPSTLGQPRGSSPAATGQLPGEWPVGAWGGQASPMERAVWMVSVGKVDGLEPGQAEVPGHDVLRERARGFGALPSTPLPALEGAPSRTGSFTGSASTSSRSSSSKVGTLVN